MPASGWIALGSVGLALVVQLVVFVRHLTKMEASIAKVADAGDKAEKARIEDRDAASKQRDKFEGTLDDMRKDLGKIDRRVENVERSLEMSKVVMLRPHHRREVD